MPQGIPYHPLIENQPISLPLNCHYLMLLYKNNLKYFIKKYNSGYK